MKFHSKIIIILTLLTSTSCNFFHKEREVRPEIRLVGLDGEYREVEINIPEYNKEYLSKSSTNNSYSNKSLEKQINNERFDNNINPNQPQSIDLARQNIAPSPNESNITGNVTKENAIAGKPETNSLDTNNKMLYGETNENTNAFGKEGKLLNENSEIESNDIDIDLSKEKQKEQEIDKKYVKSKTRYVPVIGDKTSEDENGKTQYYVQIGSFLNSKNAQRLIDEIGQIDNKQVKKVKLGNKYMYRSIVGPYDSKRKALEMMKQINQEYNKNAVIIKF